jgi:hypothetical protein
MSNRKDPTQLWQRRRRESARAYAAFCKYRDLGAEIRSIDRAYRVGRDQTTERAPRRWFHWSQAFDWAKRVKAWDEHLAAVNQAEKEQAAKREAQEWAERRRQLRERKWRMSGTFLDRAESVLRLPLVRTRMDGGTTIVEPVGVRLADSARLGEIAARLGDEAIADARLEAAQTGATAPRIVNCVFRPPWLGQSETETAPPEAASDEDDRHQFRRCP